MSGIGSNGDIGTYTVGGSNWHHFVMSHDKSEASEFKIYIDGSLAGTFNRQNAAADSTGNIRLGSHATGEVLDGKMDEVRIYNRPMPLAEITDHYNHRKYASSDPTPVVGSEESQGGSPASETIVPKTGHIFSTVSGFSATVSGTGTVKFQVTPDNGSNWKYCVGDTLTAATDGYTHSNTAAELTDNCLDDLAAGTFNVRVYLYAGEGQTATISNLYALAIANTAPTASAITPSQTATGTVTLTSTVADVDSDVTSLTVEYSTDNAAWNNATIATATQAGSEGDGITIAGAGSLTDLDTDNDGSVDVTIGWNVGTDLADTDDSTVYFRITANDGTVSGTAATSAAFAVDTLAPTVPSALTSSSIATTGLNIVYPVTPTIDTNFSEYKIYYSTSTPVTESDTAITSSTDANLGSINFSGNANSALGSLTANTTYYFNIFAYDSWDRSSSAASELSITTLATAVSLLTATVDNTNQITLSWSGDSTGYYVENTTAGTNSGWTSDVTWADSTLGCRTTYSYRIKGRNAELVETAYSSAVTAQTRPCSRSTSFAAVPKPYLSNPTSSSLFLNMSTGSNPSHTEYAIQEVSSNRYVQPDRTLGNYEVWRNNFFWSNVVLISELSANTPYSFVIKSKIGSLTPAVSLASTAVSTFVDTTDITPIFTTYPTYQPVIETPVETPVVEVVEQVEQPEAPKSEVNSELSDAVNRLTDTVAELAAKAERIKKQIQEIAELRKKNLLDYYFARYEIKCSSPDSARCLWAKIDLSSAQKFTGKTKIDLNFSFRDILLIKMKIQQPQQERYQKECAAADWPEDYCPALKDSLNRIWEVVR